MGSSVVPFAFCDALLRCKVIDGKPWFVASDVCRILGMSNPTEAVKPLDDDEKGLSSTETLGGPQEAVIISESGFYTIVLRSRQATTPGTVAHRFRKWVTSEVLPSLRRKGTYATPPRYTPSRAGGGDKATARVRRIIEQRGPLKLSELTYLTNSMPAGMRSEAVAALEAEGFLRREVVEGGPGRPATILYPI